MSGTDVCILKAISYWLIRVAIAGAATCDEREIARFNSQLSNRGRATIDIHVQVNQQGVECLAGTLGWFVLKDASS